MARYERLLVPTDFSPASDRGVRRAADIARDSGAEVLLVFVVEKGFFAPMSVVHQAPVTFGGEGDLLGEAVDDAEKRLTAMRSEVFDGLECSSRVSVAPNAASGILDQCERFRPDLVVMSSEGRTGVKHLLLGSTAEKVVRHAPCEVLVVKAAAPPAATPPPATPDG